MSCSVPKCSREATRRGMCGTHYQRWYRHGDPTVRLPPGPGFRGMKPELQAQIRRDAGVKGAAVQDRNREASGYWLRWLLQSVRRELASW